MVKVNKTHNQTQGKFAFVMWKFSSTDVSVGWSLVTNDL